MKTNSRISQAVLYIFFLLFSLLMIYPLWYVLMYSLSDPDKGALTHHFLTPNGFSLDTYKYVIKQPFLSIGYKNSIFVTLVGTIVSLFLTTISAFPLSRKNLVGRKAIFGLFMFTMLFGGGMIPTYLVVRGLGLVDSLWALILPSALSVYNMLIMMKFFATISESLIDSAKIDGYDDISILFRIILPLLTPVIATIGLFYAVSRWNAYMPGVLYINDAKKRVLQVVLRNMLVQEDLAAQLGDSGQAMTPQTMKMAAIMLTVLPILCVYPYIQKYFITGIMLGSVKE